MKLANLGYEVDMTAKITETCGILAQSNLTYTGHCIQYPRVAVRGICYEQCSNIRLPIQTPVRSPRSARRKAGGVS